ncbi:MAG: response regulator [Blastocatellia bacterium]|nr:response regulator [Blastocatellia bacterium]
MQTVLVVDDSMTVRKMVAKILEKAGYNVEIAADGIEALAKLETLRPDLILLDITMPGPDGYKVCKDIKSNKELKHVNVLMLSGKDGFFDKIRGKMAGATEYITKPFEAADLLQRVEKYLKK